MVNFSRLIALVWLLSGAALSADAALVSTYSAVSFADAMKCGTTTPSATCTTANATTALQKGQDAGLYTCYWWNTGPTRVSVSPNFQWVEAFVRTGAGCTGTTFSAGVYEVPSSCNTATPGTACYVAPACGSGANRYYFDQIRSVSSAAAEAAIASCYNGCGVESVATAGPGLNKDGAGTFLFPVTIKTTGAVCSGGGGGSVPPTTPAAQPTGENCVTSAAGVEYCSGPYGENCGYVNDKFVCLGKTDDDECWVNDDGSRLCGTNAPLPPVPDNGTPGVKATPTDTVKAAEGDTVNNTYNYYNSGTVAGSSRAPGDSGANPNRPTSGDPATSPGGTGGGTPSEPSGTASGGLSCDTAPTCDGDPVGCALLQQQWRTRCTDVTAADALEAMGATEDEIAGNLAVGDVDMGSWSSSGPLGGSGCPAPLAISVMGHSLSLDVWKYACDMALLFAPFVMAMGWFLGAMLFIRGGV